MKRMILCLVAIALLAAALMIPARAAKEPFRALRAVRISPTEVVVEFSAPLKASSPSSAFVALRRMVMRNGAPVGLASVRGEPQQTASTSWRFWSEDDHTRIVYAFDETMIDRYLDQNHNLYKQGYRTYFGIEEKNPPSGHSHSTLQGFLSSDGRELASTLPAGGGGWDGVYFVLETDYSYGLGTLPEDPTVTLPAGAETDAATSDPNGEEESGCGSVLSAPALILSLMPLAALSLKRKRH